MTLLRVLKVLQFYYNKLDLQYIVNQESRMQSGARIQNQPNKNSFAANNFENQFLSEYDDSQYSQQQSSSIPNQNPESKDLTQSKNKQSEIKGQFHVDVVNKNDSQLKAIKKANNNLDKLSKSISALKQEYKDINWDEKLFNKRDKKKQKEIQQFLIKKKKEKKQRQQKLQKIKERQQKKREEFFTKQQTQQVRKKPAHKIMLKNKEAREQELQKSQLKTKEVSQLIEKYKEKKPFHERKLEEDLKHKKQWEEKYKQNLLSIHERYKPLDQQQLQEHQRKHDQYIASIQKVKRSQKQQKFLKIIEENNKLQANLFRGNAHDIIQQEQEQKIKRKKKPKEQYEKIKKYDEYVRENFIPVPRTYDHKKSVDISLERSLEKSNVSSKSHRQVKRYRFFQGVNFGEIIENRKIAKSQAEQRKIGNLYLNQLKSLPKKKPQQKSPQFSPSDLQMIQYKLHSIVKIKKQRNPLYDHSKKKNLNVKVSSNPTRQELQVLMLELKGKDQRMKMKQKVIRSQRHGNVQSVQQKQKQVNQGIIDNIERKLSLLSQL